MPRHSKPGTTRQGKKQKKPKQESRVLNFLTCAFFIIMVHLLKNNSNLIEPFFLFIPFGNPNSNLFLMIIRSGPLEFLYCCQRFTDNFGGDVFREIFPDVPDTLETDLAELGL